MFRKPNGPDLSKLNRAVYDTTHMDRFIVRHSVMRWSFFSIQHVSTHLPVDYPVEYQETPSSLSHQFFKRGKKSDRKWFLCVTMESPLLIITENSDRDLATAVVFFLLLVRTW